MATLLELSTIARSNDLKDMMVILFKSENKKYLNTTNNMSIVAENLATRVRERVQLIGELDHFLCSTIAYESAKLLREINDVDLAKARALMAGISHIQIKSPSKGAIVGGIKWPKLYQEVLGRERNGDVVEQLEFSDEFCHLSGEFCNELNHDFLKLFESSICNCAGTPLDADTDEEFDETEDHLLEKEFMIRLEEEERLLLEEEKRV
ncbi:hypothetical protein Tco_1538805 [Tanacetum coccineum]